MSAKRCIASSQVQPRTFEFSAKNKKKVKEILSKYPYKESAILPLLHLVQEQHDNWVPIAAMEKIGEIIDMPYIKVVGVASFYTMINLAPVGRHLVQLCRTTPCWLRGAGKLRKVLTEELGLEHEGITHDGKFTLREVECLGACVNAPAVQINDQYYENLDEKKLKSLLNRLR